MYAVFSLLRRVAISSIYVRFEEAKDGIRIEKSRDVLDLQTTKWLKQATVPVFKLTAKGTSPEIAAVELAKKENEIFYKAGLGSKHFTLLAGPEGGGSDDNGLFFRSSHLGVVRGIFRSPMAEVGIRPAESSVKAVKRVHRRIPKGVILEER